MKCSIHSSMPRSVNYKLREASCTCVTLVVCGGGQLAPCIATNQSYGLAGFRRFWHIRVTTHIYSVSKCNWVTWSRHTLCTLIKGPPTYFLWLWWWIPGLEWWIPGLEGWILLPRSLGVHCGGTTTTFNVTLLQTKHSPRGRTTTSHHGLLELRHDQEQSCAAK